jgi:predicted peptidase
MKASLAAALALGGWAAWCQAADAPGTPAPAPAPKKESVQTEHKLEAKFTFRDRKTGKETTRTLPMGYLLFLPEGCQAGEAAEKRWPLMLFLHGAGERGESLELVKKHGPPKRVERKKDFPFILVSPQCPAGAWWPPEPLIALLDEIAAKYPVDADRVYVTGLSMGGFGTWVLAARQPDRFAAIVPICGGGDPAKAPLLKDIPTWVFHGARDRLVPPKRSEEMVEAMKKAGAENVQLTVYPEAGHDSWSKTYDDPKLYEWLLKQNRKDRKKAQPATQPAVLKTPT